MGILRQVSSGSLTIKTWGSSLEITRSILGTHETDGRLLSCSFLHSEFFKLSGDLRVVLILANFQSPVLSTSLLNKDFGRTCRNPATWIMAWKNWQSTKILGTKKTFICDDSAHTVRISFVDYIYVCDLAFVILKVIYSFKFPADFWRSLLEISLLPSSFLLQVI